MSDTLRIGMVGTAFMGTMHAHAWRTAPHFFDLPRQPELTILAGRDETRTAAAAARHGFARSSTDWHSVIDDDEVDLVDICTPGDLHTEIALAALAAGKHVLCEKPLANTVADAERMAEAATAAAAHGVWAMCGYSYRRTPALTLAHDLAATGRLGTIRHVRAMYLQDWLSDESAPMTWRLDATKAGSGSLGDLGAHLIDTAQWITGQSITQVSGLLETFVASRPLVGEMSGLGGKGAVGDDVPRGPVTVDDAALFLARFDGGAVGSFEATRFALGHKNAFRVEVNGTDGSVAFDFEHHNHLEFVDGADPGPERGFRLIHVTEADHPYAGAWWPPGHGLGYDHAFVHQVVDLVRAIGEGRQPRPSFADALGVQRVLDAVSRSAGTSAGWTPVAPS